MKKNLSFKVLLVSSCCFLLLTFFAQARISPAWPHEKLTAEADLIVIATPTAVRDTEERTTVPTMAALKAIGVETTFEISSILKGQTDTKTIIYHHLREAENLPVVNGPCLVSFDPKEKKSFLLFLKREADGRYASLTGQTDPTDGVKLLEYPPFATPNQTAAQSGNKAKNPINQALESDKPSAEDVALVKGLIVKGTVKQAIGSFSGHSFLHIGATFELDLSNLPKEKLLFTLPPANPLQQPRNGGYIPFNAPMEIEKVKKSGTGRVGIYLAANDSHGKFLIQIVGDLPPKPGSWCSVLLYREGIGGFISSSMAEAGGEITVKDSVAANLPPKAGEQNKPNAQQWPPPLDEKRIIGTWVRKNAPTQGVENHTLLILREDHSWNEAEISGPLTEPVRFKKFASDSKWEVVNVGEKNTQTMLLFKHKEGGSNVWNILKVGAEELDFSSYGPSIIDLRHYTRCEEQTAAKLNERLIKEAPGASSK